MGRLARGGGRNGSRKAAGSHVREANGCDKKADVRKKRQKRRKQPKLEKLEKDEKSKMNEFIRSFSFCEIFVRSFNRGNR
jgi:hypothetical protein